MRCPECHEFWTQCPCCGESFCPRCGMFESEAEEWEEEENE